MFRRPGRGRFLLAAFLVLSIGVITLDFQTEGEGPLDKARDVASNVVAPIQRGVSVVVRPVRNFFASLGDLGDLRSENARLKERLDSLEVKSERADAIEEENAELRKTLGLEAPWFKGRALAVEVISSQPANYKWAVTVSKGEDDGIKSNMAVVDGSQRGLVGKTVEPISDDTATVLLLVDPRGAAKAKIKGVKDTGTVSGNGGGVDLSMEYVEPTANVKEGALVSTETYDGGVFPPNIPIGTVSDVTGDEAGLSQEIDVAPAIDFEDLQTLLVLLDTGPIEDIKGNKRT